MLPTLSIGTSSTLCFLWGAQLISVPKLCVIPSGGQPCNIADVEGEPKLLSLPMLHISPSGGRQSRFVAVDGKVKWLSALNTHSSRAKPNSFQ